MDIPFMKGRQCIATFYLGGVKKEVLCKSHKITRNVTKINDGVNGEDRDRLDAETNFFDVALTCYGKDAKLLDAFLEEQATQDAGGQPLDVAEAFALKPRDGSKVAYSFSEGVLDDWSHEAAGRTDRQMYSIPLRFRYLKRVPL